LDLSYSRLAGLRFFDARIEDCMFRAASCRDWRLWGSAVDKSSFAGADLRDAALGTWDDGRSNAWTDVSFDEADVRGALFSGCRLFGCTFADSRLSGAEFLHADIESCVFAGAVADVLFDGRKLPGRRQVGPMRAVDFSAAAFSDVEFRGYLFDGVRLPAGVHAVPHYPEVAKRALERLGAASDVEARMLIAELRNVLKAPGSEDWTGVFNRADYVIAGGERFAELAGDLLLER
jgi:uncharacterized protein YjbI with pentapeptide repeats